MRLSILFFTILLCWADVLVVDVPIPQYRIINNEIIMQNGSYMDIPGTPKLPCRKLTIALPPSAICESVEFSGTWKKIGNVAIPPIEPVLPLRQDEKIITKSVQMYEKLKDRIYAANTLYPETFGTLLSKGGLRKYTLITIACHHFAYQAASQQLYYAPHITVEIQYRMPQPESDRAQFCRGLMDDIIYDEIAAEVIYNWHSAQNWYKTHTPNRTNGYMIILPSALETAVDDLVAYRQSQGYDVAVVTTEYIEANIAGDDSPQKIRNYLRQNMADIEYVLLVGTIYDIPMRSLVPFNDDPDSPYNDPTISPIPTDLYYAELTDHDSLSWNSDGDSYYGEVYNANMEPYGDDDVDYHADVHLGRIPFTTQSNIEEICQKMILFDGNTNRYYKTSALLAGGMIYFESENYSSYPRIDGADNMELLMNDSILDRSKAVYLYEKAGLSACPYSCIDSLTRNNMISYWNDKGIVFEYNHGSPYDYWRKVWTYDDGDSIPENHEMQWYKCLDYSDVFSLDDEHPATTFLLSCSCGRPEVNSLGKYLLYRGSSSVICAMRTAWVPRHDSSLAHHFLNRLMKDTTLSHSIVADAYDLGRNDHMDASSFWMNTYVFNLYGDPALHQLGITLIGVEETEKNTSFPSFSVCPNPTSGAVTVYLSMPERREIQLDVYDECGRLVEQIFNGCVEEGAQKLETELPAGIYFLQFSAGDYRETKKLIFLK